MEITIGHEMWFSDIQKQFNDCYPNLRLEFFNVIDHQQPFRQNKIDPTTPIGKFAKSSGFKQVNIDNKRILGDLKNELSEMLGVHAQVFRKSGTSWIPTSFTDNWDLEKQNISGQF